jgi:Cu(I)/Ag(I) efflux system membrane fusion protein
MNTSLRKIALAAAAVAALAAAWGLYQLGMKRGMDVAATPKAATTAAAGGDGPGNSIAIGEAATRRHIEQGIKAGDTDPATGQKVLYYRDPMVPDKHFDAPAKSPFMDMMLVPVYGGNETAGDNSNVTVSPRIQQNLGLRTAEVVQGWLRPQATAVGSVAWNERDQSVVQARAAGFIEKLHVRATLDRVAKGQVVAELLLPEWVAAQEEFLAVKQAAGTDLALVTAARQRLKLLGMNDEQIAVVENSNTVQARQKLLAPSAGVIAELAAREGMTVAPGMLLARINGLASVWVLAELPESQAAAVHPGSAVEVRLPSAPDAVLRGTVQALLPEVNPATRTIKARIELANPRGTLSPGMFVTVQFAGSRTDAGLLIPTEALIQTGQRSLVMLAEAGGHFTPVAVEAGLESGGQTEIRRGLKLGQRVVVSSQFLIDSEASLKGVEARLNAQGDAGGARP